MNENLNRRAELTALLGVCRDWRRQLQERPKLLDCKASIAGDTAHCDGVNRVVARNGKDARPVADDDMLALPKDNKPRLLQRSDCIAVIDAGKLG